MLVPFQMFFEITLVIRDTQIEPCEHPSLRSVPNLSRVMLFERYMGFETYYMRLEKRGKQEIYK